MSLEILQTSFTSTEPNLKKQDKNPKTNPQNTESDNGTSESLLDHLRAQDSKSGSRNTPVPHKNEVNRPPTKNSNCQTLLEPGLIGCFTLNRSLQIVEANSAGARMLSRKHISKNTCLLNYLSCENKDAIKDHFNSVFTNSKATLCVNISYQEISTQVMFYSLTFRDPVSDDVLCQTTVIPVGNQHAHNSENLGYPPPQHSSGHYDTLTGLPNRLYFNEQLGDALRRAGTSGEKVALLLLDLDRFKNINNSLGHLVGDALLKEVAIRINNSVRDCDIVSRLGGDEFTVIIEQIDSISEVSEIAKNICQALTNPFTADGQEIYTDASIGVSVYPTDSVNIEQLIRFADAAMYKAKSSAQSRIQFFTAELNTEFCTRFKLENDLRIGFRNSQFELYYQPQYDITRKAITGYEALVRWNHPELGIIGPDSFIGIAEETGMIHPLGEWILTEAFTKLSQLIDSGHTDLRMSVNISALQLNYSNLPKKISNILKKTGAPAYALELELTESALLENTEVCIENLHALRDIGINLSIDDFGTGYSSLSRLRELPISRIKIDKSFVVNLPDNESDNCVIDAIISVAHQLDLEVVMEGVETDLQAACLTKMNCDLIQGYYIGKPQKFESVLQQLSVENNRRLFAAVP